MFCHFIQLIGRYLLWVRSLRFVLSSLQSYRIAYDDYFQRHNNGKKLLRQA
jgi:hypothetical protein